MKLITVTDACIHQDVTISNKFHGQVVSTMNCIQDITGSHFGKKDWLRRQGLT
jgi:hypothetical protein